MFTIGDRVSYPMHGAGTVEAIEERVILGEARTYFMLRFFNDGVTVMVPTEGGTGLRSVLGASDARDILYTLKDAPEDCDDNWNRRYRLNLDRIRTGDPSAVADVIRSLTLRERGRGLSTGERRMLTSARQILCSELMVSFGITLDEAYKCLDAALHASGDEEQLVPVAR